MNKKAIIFDMDGVLINSLPMHIKIWKQVFSSCNIPFSLEFFNNLNGSSSKEIAKYLINHFSLDCSIAFILEQKYSLEEKYKESEITLFSDTLFVLKYLKKLNIKTAIGTSSKKEMFEFIDSKFNLSSFVDSVVYADLVKKSKPAPDIFLLAAKKIAVNPNDCFVVEDAVNGVLAANSAGMTSVAITNTCDSSHFPMANYIISNLKELISLVKNFN
jgi:beta-phosphoglucomutase family hydrolase